MPIPDGAHHVRFTFTGATADGEEVDVQMTASLEPHIATEVDAALAAGAETILATLRAAFPGGTVGAVRRYETHTPGDPWPPTEEP